MSGRWVDSLPEVDIEGWDQQRLQASALNWLVGALDSCITGQPETCHARLAWAGARIRVWRLSLPNQSARWPSHSILRTSDRELILGAIRWVGAARPTATNLRIAEAHLRTIWRRAER